jgi:hypothetical protein
MFLELAKLLQTGIFLQKWFALVFRRFTRVAARLLHKGRTTWVSEHLPRRWVTQEDPYELPRSAREPI